MGPAPLSLFTLFFTPPHIPAPHSHPYAGAAPFLSSPSSRRGPEHSPLFVHTLVHTFTPLRCPHLHPYAGAAPHLSSPISHRSRRVPLGLPNSVGVPPGSRCLGGTRAPPGRTGHGQYEPLQCVTAAWGRDAVLQGDGGQRRAPDRSTKSLILAHMGGAMHSICFKRTPSVQACNAFLTAKGVAWLGQHESLESLQCVAAAWGRHAAV